MRAGGALRGLLLAAALAGAAPAIAQVTATATPVVTLDQDRLFAETRYGQAVQKALDVEVSALAAENRRIEGELETEERDLTERRASLPTEEFRKLADAFDAKAEEIRKTQDGKVRALSRRRDGLRQTFFERAKPILGQLMAERGAVAVLDKGVIVLAFDRIDMTDAAIARLDVVMGDGTGPRVFMQPLPEAADDGPPPPAAGADAPAP